MTTLKELEKKRKDPTFRTPQLGPDPRVGLVQSATQSVEAAGQMAFRSEEQRRLENLSFTNLVGQAVLDRNSLVQLQQLGDRFFSKLTQEEDQSFNKKEYLEDHGVDPDHYDFFDGVQSKKVADKFFKQYNEDVFAKKAFAANPVAGIAASALAEFGEPVNYLIFGRGATAAASAARIPKAAGVLSEATTRGAAARGALEGSASETVISILAGVNSPTTGFEGIGTQITAGALAGGILGAGGKKVADLMGISQEAIHRNIVEAFEGVGDDTPSTLRNVFNNSLEAEAEVRKSIGASGDVELNAADLRASGNIVFKKMMGLAEKISPTLRGVNSKNTEMVKAYAMVGDIPFVREGAKLDESGAFKAAPKNAALLQERIFTSVMAGPRRKHRDLYRAYIGKESGLEAAVDAITAGQTRRKSTHLTMSEVNQLVGKALRRNETASDLKIRDRSLTDLERKLVEDSAKVWREEFFNPIREKLIELKILPEDVTPEFANSYIMRRYDLEKLKARDSEWISALRGWGDELFEDNLNVLKQQFQEGKIKADDDDLRFFSNKQNKDEYIEEVALAARKKILRPETMDDGTAAPDPVFRSVDSLKRGPIKERTLSAHDLDIEDFLIDDIEGIANDFLRITSGEIALTETMGTARFSDALQGTNGSKVNLEEGFDAARRQVVEGFDEKLKGLTGDARIKMQAKKDKEIIALEKRFQDEKDSLKNIMELVRGTFLAENPSIIHPDSDVKKGIMATRMLANMAFLSNVVMGQIPDLAMPIFVHGLSNTVKHGYAPMVKRLMSKEFKNLDNEVLEDLREAGLAVQDIVNTRIVSQMMFEDTNVPYKTGFETFLEKAGGNFGNITLMNQMNNMTQAVSGRVAMQRIYKMANKKKLTQKDADFLSTIGIDSVKLAKIKSKLDRHGSVHDNGSTILGNWDAWGDPELVSDIQDALFRANRAVILERSAGDVPIFMNTMWGKIMGQFMSHTMLSHNRILMSSLQRADKTAATGLVSLVALGTLTYYLKTISGGREPSDDWRVWLAEGVDHSGVASLMMLANKNFAEPFGIGLSNLVNDEEYNKFAKQGGIEMTGGAAFGYLNNFFRGTRAIKDQLISGESSQADIMAGLRAMPYSNLLPIRILLGQWNNHMKEDFGE